VWILVIHYDFSDNKSDESSRESGNARDLELLKNLFNEYEDCTFRDFASPLKSEIAGILSNDGILSCFNDGTYINLFTVKIRLV
jgi:hypothetical protein